MGPLAAQVQRASDTAKFVAVRVGGAENVAMADNEATFDELYARIDRTIGFIRDVPREAFNDKEEAAIALVTPGRTIDFTGASYVAHFAVPNFWFHVTTAYAILRMIGVPVGKLDYLGQPPA
jgi:uncharacterized protein